MGKFKVFIIVSGICTAVIFLFAPTIVPENPKFQEILSSASDNEILIVFNSGGLGHTPLEEASDFSPIIRGIEETLNEKGYKVAVVSYSRTKDNFWGEIAGVKGTFKSFKEQSEDLSLKIKDFLNDNPENKVIVAGLSQGGAFADKTIEKLNGFHSRVLAIEAGVPFWQEKVSSENVLRLDNNGKDPVVKGDFKTLLFNLFESPVKWIFAKFARSNLTFIDAIHAPGHDYYWSDSEHQIVSFLENKLK
jgi:hypothetical protein